MHSRLALFMTLVIMIVATLYASSLGDIMPVGEQRGIIGNVGTCYLDGTSGLWVNILAVAVVIAMMVYINKAFTIPRTITLIYATFFCVFQTATPAVCTRFYSGTVLCMTMTLSMILMFNSFSQMNAERRVVMVFFLLSSAIAIDYAYAVYIPVFLIACAQMRIFCMRVCLAAGLGLLTPWWLLLGFGIVTPADFHMPDFSSAIDGFGRTSFILAVTLGLTIVLVISSYLLCVLKIMTYNARTRACNGLMTLVTLTTVILAICDFGNVIIYIPLLNFGAAFLLSQLFIIRNTAKSWLYICAIFITYYSIYAWRIFV